MTEKTKGAKRPKVTQAPVRHRGFFTKATELRVYIDKMSHAKLAHSEKDFETLWNALNRWTPYRPLWWVRTTETKVSFEVRLFNVPQHIEPTGQITVVCWEETALAARASAIKHVDLALKTEEQ